MYTTKETTSRAGNLWYAEGGSGGRPETTLSGRRIDGPDIYVGGRCCGGGRKGRIERGIKSCTRLNDTSSSLSLQ